uniref:Bri3 binding protein n=1 Tax=Sinocyclocheilus rhinocerous TaxID=307959 RepID=A0A673HLW4_9TELE
MKGAKLAVVLSVFLAFVLLTETARSKRDSSSQNSFRRAASGFYQTFSNIFGEENIRALYKFFSKTTERFVYGVDSLLDTLWKLWVDLLDVMGIDSHLHCLYVMPKIMSLKPPSCLSLLSLCFYFCLSVFSFSPPVLSLSLASNLTHYFSPSSVSSSPARALLLPVFGMNRYTAQHLFPAS